MGTELINTFIQAEIYQERDCKARGQHVREEENPRRGREGFSTSGKATRKTRVSSPNFKFSRTGQLKVPPILSRVLIRQWVCSDHEHEHNVASPHSQSPRSLFSEARLLCLLALKFVIELGDGWWTMGVVLV